RVDDLMGRALGGQDNDDPGGAAAGDQVTGQRGELLLLFEFADGGGEVGVFVDQHQVDRLTAVLGDLPPSGGEQRVVAGVHELLERGDGGEGIGHGRADEHVGAVPPGAEFDELAVDQHQLAVARHGAVGGDQVQG